MEVEKNFLNQINTIEAFTIEKFNGKIHYQNNAVVVAF